MGEIKKSASQKDDDTDENYERLLRHFLLKAKKGIVLNLDELKTYCKKRHIFIPERRLKEMRYEFKFTAMHSSAVKPLGFMGNSVLKYGTWFVDYCHMPDRLARKNNGHRGMLVFVEGISNKTYALPMKKKDTMHWKMTINRFLREHDDEVRTFVSDRDSVVTRIFRDYIKKRYNISWIFLYNRSKSFRAETMISYLKERLATGMDGSNDGEWVKLLPGIIRDYNSKMIKGTKIRRTSVNKHNYMDFLAKKFDTDYPSLMINGMTGHVFIPEFNRKLFKFQIGEKVLLRSDSAYSSKKKTFKKKPWKVTTIRRYSQW